VLRFPRRPTAMISIARQSYESSVKEQPDMMVRLDATDQSSLERAALIAQYDEQRRTLQEIFEKFDESP
jgi:hypothetical protein